MSTLTIPAETRSTSRLWSTAIPLMTGLALWAAVFHAEIIVALTVWWQSARL